MKRKQFRQIRIAPDGMLNLVPFASLTDGQGHYLIERFVVSYVTAGRDLAAPAPTGKPSGPMIIALSPGTESRPRRLRVQPRTYFGPIGWAPGKRREGGQRPAPTSASVYGEGEATEQRVSNCSILRCSTSWGMGW
ncbi:MAG: CHAT domain-containing protein [Terriglobia bacterium]